VEARVSVEWGLARWRFRSRCAIVGVSWLVPGGQTVGFCWLSISGSLEKGDSLLIRMVRLGE
jgi:hypothetical protein